MVKEEKPRAVNPPETILSTEADGASTSIDSSFDIGPSVALAVIVDLSPDMHAHLPVSYTHLTLPTTSRV